MVQPIIGQEREVKTAPVDKTKEEQRELMLDLGRKLAETIEAFFTEKKKDANMMLVLGGIDYVLRLQKERRNAVAEDFLKTKAAVEHLGVKVHEPFNNDNVPVAPDFFEMQDKQ